MILICDFLLYVCITAELNSQCCFCFTSLKLQENRCSRYRGLQLWRAKNLLSTNNLPQSLFALSLFLSLSLWLSLLFYCFPSQPTTQMPQRQRGLKVSIFTIHILTLSCTFIQEHTLLRKDTLAIAHWQDHGKTGS